MRCAIYTRKSSEEGLEQGFNSLHAQREACEAYVTSQRHEGWKVLPTAYDDGGFSGGSMNRPGLQRLLSDIQSGLIDVVVVYKVDRLTRSLTDFARIVETFDARGVSFVSVTQSFNTTSSMGRLTLNVLLSFAQFEREVTGERIRDKIAASKKKGLWMGGYVPMGYAKEGRSLRIAEEDAAVIRRIFDRYLKLGSVRELKDELDRQGITTRAFTSGSNKEHGAKPFSIGHLWSILKNPIYAGEVAHKGSRYKAQHEAIVSRATFQAVQAKLNERTAKHRLRTHAKHGNMLLGLLFSEDGSRFKATHAVKNGKRYRYYVSEADAQDGVAGQGGPRQTGAERSELDAGRLESTDARQSSWTRRATRIPAAEIEPLVIDAIAAHLTDRAWLMNNTVPARASPDQILHVVQAAAAIASEIKDPVAARQQAALHRLVERAIVGNNGLSVQLKREVLEAAAWIETGPAGGRIVEDHQSHNSPPYPTIPVSARLISRGGETRLVMHPGEGGEAATEHLDQALIKAIARAVTWYEDLTSGRAATFAEIAAKEGVSERYVAQVIRLAFLAPELIAGVLRGTTELEIGTATIARGIELPSWWKEQQTSMVR
ncbi:MAG TPA: recombinase family protein [Mesorhizobium sp.]|nr:recombinase family protein [Mesorhizobium sp.]